MPPGKFVRRMLGPAFRPIGEVYRRLFVDMARVADWMALQLPDQARVLDVGGGDGYVVDLMLDRRPDIRVTMTDIAPEIGSFIKKVHRSKVEIRPATNVADVKDTYDVISLADVLHHVPVDSRISFMGMLSEAADRTGARIILIKDIRPGNLRATLALWGDWYITGDRAVRQLAEEQVHIPGFFCAASAMPDFPNYCLRFERG